MEIGICQEKELYTIKVEAGVTCLGFDVLTERTERLYAEITESFSAQLTQPLELNTSQRGTIEAYRYYEMLLITAQDLHYKHGARFICELTKGLIGLEGMRVEVIDRYNEKRRFTVGNSTGFLPCHLELHNSNSTGGGAVFGAPFKSLRIVNDRMGEK